MILTFDRLGKDYRANLSKPLEIGIAVNRDHGVSSFGIAGAKYVDYQEGDFIGNKAEGGPCNLETITFTPHGNCTHTECLGHIALETYMVNDCIQDKFYLATLCSLDLNKNDTNYLDFSSVDLETLKESDAIVIRSLPNKISKFNQDYSGKNAPCISVDDMRKLIDAEIKHIIIDLPSVDPEWDNGALAAHHIFWNYPDSPRLDASITEFAFIRDDIKDGEYLLKLNISNFESDAAPSRPVLYPIIAG